MVTVHPMPNGAITAPLLARPGDPITLALTLSTPAGTAFTDYDVSYDNGATWEPFNTVPPTTLTHTYSAEGVYTVLLTAYNDADGWADVSKQVRVDVTPPAPATNPVVSVSSVGDTWLSLSWTNPTDPDLTGAMIRRLVGATGPATVTDGDLVSDFNDRADYVINPGLTPGTQYSYTVFAHDGSGNYATGVSATGTTTGIPPHVVPPGPVSALTALGMAGDTSIKLDWVNPTDADFAGVTIRRLAGGIEPASVTDGDPVAIPASATATSFTDSGLAPGTEYSYSVFAYDVANNHAAGVKVKATTTMVTTAVLLLDTTRATVGTELFLDPALSYAARGETVTEGTLDYGDGTPLEPFTGTADGWYALHSYATAGAYVVTLTVTDSANLTVSKSVTINVLAAETATITAPAGQIKVGVDAVFTLTTTVAPVSHWTVEGDSVGFYFSDWGTPPPTVTYNFTAAGTYTVSFTVDSVNTSIQVTVSP
jgi:PKD repeat protein